MFQNMKIKSRLSISFGIIIAIACIIIIFAITMLITTEKNFNTYSHQSVVSLMAAKDCRISTLWIATDIRNLVLETDDAKERALEEKAIASIASFNEHYNLLKSTYSGDDMSVLEEYRTTIDDWFAIGEQVIAANASGDEATAHNLVLTKCNETLNKALAVSAKINTVLETERVRLEQRNELYNVASIIALLVFLIIGLITSFIISVKLTKSIVLPILEIDHAAKEMAKGNIQTKIAYYSKDEVGQLAESLRTTMSVLFTYIADIDRAMGELANGNFNLAPSQPFIGDFKNIESSISRFIVEMSSVLQTIQNSSTSVNEASSQVSASSQILAEGSNEQSSEIENLSETLAQIILQVNENATNALETNKLAEKVAGEISFGNQKMDQLMRAMDDINVASVEIGKIMVAINDISFQTNILSLNAAVEAARAGEAGKGFAVVADEVRKLSRMSADASKNTTSLIQASVNAVAHGTTLANETADALTTIMTDASEITQLIQRIADASSEQASAAEQISSSIAEISAVVENNSATAEETAAASEELNSQADLLDFTTQKFTILKL